VIRAFNFDNPAQAHNEMCKRFAFGSNKDPGNPDYDWSAGSEVGLHNVAIHCRTIDFDYDLKRLWVPPSRWAMMVRQYIDPEALADAEAKIAERMGPSRRGSESRGISILRTRMVQGKGTGRGVRRRWGSCMLNLSYRRQPVPTVSLHSRTTYFGYLALVDMAVARTFAERCANLTGVPIQDVQFVWTLDLAQFHGFRSLAWMLGNDKIRTKMYEALPNRLSYPSRIGTGNRTGWRKTLDGLQRIKKSDDAGTLYGDETFSSFARVRRRYHTEVYGEEYAEQFEGGSRNRGGKGGFPALPSTMVRDLTFAPLIGRSGEGGWFDDDEDDEE
jgi:hypothetical protein